MVDTARKHKISQVVDIELTTEEDSVTTLAIAQSSDSSASVYAGINSSSADQKAGKNEHLRSFSVGYPTIRIPPAESSGSELAQDQRRENEHEPEPKPETKAVGRVSLFTPSSGIKKETYQRVLRLSPVQKDGGSRLGAIATGLAPEGEVVIFDANAVCPGKSDVRGRIQLGKGEEAADVDIIDGGDRAHQVAYCTDFEVYLYTIPADKDSLPLGPRLLYGTPHPDTFSKTKSRPTFRSLRFLTPSRLLLLQNAPNRSGVQVLLLELTSSPPAGTVTLLKRLHKSIKSATALSVALISPASPLLPTQHVVAIAGQDTSITLLTLDLPSPNPTFRLHARLQNIHPLQITSLAFSTFRHPSSTTTPLPQYLKLASTSLSSTLHIHTLPLYLSGHSKPPKRYTLTSPSSRTDLPFSLLVASLTLALGAFLLQAFTEIRGGVPEYLGAKKWLSKPIHEFMARPYMFENASVPEVALPQAPELEIVPLPRVPGLEDVARARGEVQGRMNDAVVATAGKVGLRDLLHKYHHSHKHDDPDLRQSSERKDIIVSDSGTELSAEVRHDGVAVAEGGPRRWEELGLEERERWKRRLVEVGEWGVEEGESVLKGVFFSGVAGAVGAAVAGGLEG